MVNTVLFTAEPFSPLTGFDTNNLVDIPVRDLEAGLSVVVYFSPHRDLTVPHVHHCHSYQLGVNLVLAGGRTTWAILSVNLTRLFWYSHLCL